MEIRKEAILVFLLFMCCGETSGNTVVQSPVNPVGYKNEELELVCQLTPFPNATLRTVNWYLNTNLASMQRYTSDCTEYATGSGYDQNLYSFTCSGNIFRMKILKLLSSYNKDCWNCSVSFINADETAKATACITVREPPASVILLLLLLLLLLLPLVIIIILICCGCLDCCKCCRIYDHYDEKECCYVTCYCLKKGCCSFFYCRPGSERGVLFGGHKRKNERCGGCYFFRNKCGCGWPGFCKSKKMRSCGSCYFSCCVEELMDKGLEETSVAMTGAPALYTEIKKNKVHPLATKLPPIQDITSGETVELKEPRKKKKKKNKDKLDL